MKRSLCYWEDGYECWNHTVQHNMNDSYYIKERIKNGVSEFVFFNSVFKDLDSAKKELTIYIINQLCVLLRELFDSKEDKFRIEFVVSLLENDPIAIDALKDVLKV